MEAITNVRTYPKLIKFVIFGCFDLNLDKKIINIKVF
jgi:hypothetical protein